MFNVYPTAKVIWNRDLSFKAHPTDSTSPGSNLRSLVYKAHSGLFDRFCIDFIMIVIVLSNVKKDEITRVFNNNCFSDCKQHCGLITDPA